MLERAKACDQTYDGKFLTGVLSTGIYCLPSCPARWPKEQNIRHFTTPEEARGAGLRACKRCRPDDFYIGYDPDLEQVRATAREVFRSPEEFEDLGSVARHAGVGATKLNALFHEHYQQTPATFLLRRRVEKARHLLLTTRRRVLDIGLEVGFESNSSFHEGFRRMTGMAPGDYRRLPGSSRFVLSLPAGYRSNDTLGFHGRDSASACERVDAGVLSKAITLGDETHVLTITFSEGEARCEVTGDSHAVEAHAVAVRLLHLDSDPGSFERRTVSKLGEGRLVRDRLGARVPLTSDPFECLVWAIVGQQVNLPFAYALRRRVVRACGTPIGDLWAHPTPEQVAALDYSDLAPLQFSRRKAEYLIDCARLVVSGELVLTPEEAQSVVELRESLTAVRGLGPWSVEYLFIRGLGYPDCVPLGDAGLVAALRRYYGLEQRPEPGRIQELLEPFAPWRSLATFHFWQLLGESA